MTQPGKPGTRPGGAFSNGVKPMHAAILLVFYVIKYGYGAASGAASSDHGEAGAEPEGHGGHGDDHHGYTVFHVEFERVQLPFIISLWIFVSSLAKIGKTTDYYVPPSLLP